MTSLLIAGIMGALLLMGMLAVYAVPIRRTHRKDLGYPLERPGPEIEPYETTPASRFEALQT